MSGARGWHWQPNGDEGFILYAPGMQLAATVSRKRVWFVWDPDGDGGQNDTGTSINDAKWCALHAAKVWWYENGWATPSS